MQKACPPTEYVPAGHASGAESVTAQEEPGAQVTHTAQESREYVPATHGVSDPVDVHRKPAGHAVQEVTEEFENVPGTQGTGETEGSEQECPLGQELQES